VVAVATLHLRRLQARRVETFDDLRAHLSGAQEGVGTLFLPALSLLFLLGLIEYRPKTDAFEYTGR
jgi:hypothetical protein